MKIELEKISEQPMLPTPPHSFFQDLMGWTSWLSATIFTSFCFMLFCYSIWRLFGRPSWREAKQKGLEVTQKLQEKGAMQTFGELAETSKQKVGELAETSKQKVGELAETSKQKMGGVIETFRPKSFEQMTPEERVKSMTVIALLGPPGIGKGALSRHISPDFDIVHVSTGELIRKEIAQKTDIGLKVQAQVARGKLVPDEIVAQLIEKKFKELAADSQPHQGILLDGFPRQLSQADLLDSGRFNIPPLAAVISITMPDEVLDIRRSGRRICPQCAATYNLHEVDQGPYHLRPRIPEKEGKCDNDGAELIPRPDDEMSVASSRMKEYHLLAPPMINFYKNKGILIQVEKQRQMKHIYKEIKPELERLILNQKSQGLPAVALARAADAFEFSKEKAGQASAFVQENAGPTLEMAKEKAGQASALIQEKAGPALEMAKEKAVQASALVQEKAMPALEIAKEKAGQASALVQEKAGPALEMAKEKAGQAAAFVQEKAGAGVALAKETVVNLTDRTAATASKTKDEIATASKTKDEIAAASKTQDEIVITHNEFVKTKDFNQFAGDKQFERSKMQFNAPMQSKDPFKDTIQESPAAKRFGNNAAPEIQRARG